jgi:hypothetical protein
MRSTLAEAASREETLKAELANVRRDLQLAQEFFDRNAPVPTPGTPTRTTEAQTIVHEPTGKFLYLCLPSTLYFLPPPGEGACRPSCMNPQVFFIYPQPSTFFLPRGEGACRLQCMSPRVALLILNPILKFPGGERHMQNTVHELIDSSAHFQSFTLFPVRGVWYGDTQISSHRKCRPRNFCTLSPMNQHWKGYTPVLQNGESRTLRS